MISWTVLGKGVKSFLGYIEDFVGCVATRDDLRAAMYKSFRLIFLNYSLSPGFYPGLSCLGPLRTGKG
jgi:hypothetical protein